MKHRISLVILGALVVLNMGGSCRQDAAEDAFNAFLNEIAVLAGQAVGESIVGSLP